MEHPTITPTTTPQSTFGDNPFGDSAFSHGEAENIVIQLRAHLRQGNEDAANRLAETILMRLGARFKLPALRPAGKL